MRQQWTAKRYDDPIRTQMHYARKGVVTEEMWAELRKGNR